jgi:hypothetical protein
MESDGKARSHRRHRVKVTTPKRLRAEATTLKFNGLIGAFSIPQ